MNSNIFIKRVYEEPSEQDGFRILVDRLWPRGLSKTRAKIDLWYKNMAPTSDLRKWFAHEPARWEGFQKKYIEELKQNTAVETFVNTLKKNKINTLVYGARDEQHNHAWVLQQFLNAQLK